MRLTTIKSSHAFSVFALLDELPDLLTPFFPAFMADLLVKLVSMSFRCLFPAFMAGFLDAHLFFLILHHNHPKKLFSQMYQDIL